MLRACLLFWLAGCDLVFDLERPGHDEDSDGTPDDFDGCPHLAAESPTDADGDGIPAACDADDSSAMTTRLFWTFLDGQRPAELRAEGSAMADPDAEALVLGQRSEGMHALILDVTTDIALIDIGVEFLDNAIEDDGRDVAYAELGLFAAHDEFTQDLKTRGDNCFVGRNKPPGVGFLELNEDDESRGSGKAFDPPLTGAAGRMRATRTQARFDCAFVRSNGPETADGYEIEDNDRSGKIAITAERLRARLTYVWITYQ